MAEQAPAYVYDPDDWEATYHWGDRDDLAEHFEMETGGVRKVATLIQGPDRFVARIALSRDENGDPDETEIQWFETEAEAKAAANR